MLMTYPAAKLQVPDAARRIHNGILNVQEMLVKSLADNAVGDFNALVLLPSYNARANNYISSVIGQGNDAVIKAELDELLGADVTIADIQGFLAALDSLSTTIINNSDLLVMTFNTESLQPEYITPIASGALTTLQNKIQSALDFLG